MSDFWQYCRVSYLKGNAFCGESDAWDTCKVQPLSTYSGYGTQSFTPAQIFERDNLLALLNSVFELGKDKKLSEIQTMLGIKK